MSGDQETENDRDIFLQIYDYQSRQFTHPVMMTTTPDLAESKVKFVRSGDVTLLTYLADNTLYAMNVSVLKNGLLKSEIEVAHSQTSFHPHSHKPHFQMA